MSQLQIVECQGYNTEDAFKDLEFDPDNKAVPGHNATQAWNQAGKPIPGTKAFLQFISQQINLKIKDMPGLGIYIVLDPPIADTRKKPYTIINNKVTQIRHKKPVYLIKEAEFETTITPNMETDYDGNLIQTGESSDITVTKKGLIVAEIEKKADAIAMMKELTSTYKKSYVAEEVWVPDSTPIAAYSIYTPSLGTKKGTWVAAGIPVETKQLY